MSLPQRTLKDGVYRPLRTTSKLPAKECCCGAGTCSAYAQSIEGQTLGPCGWAQFTTPAACEPTKYYRDKVFSFNVVVPDCLVVQDAYPASEETSWYYRDRFQSSGGTIGGSFTLTRERNESSSCVTRPVVSGVVTAQNYLYSDIGGNTETGSAHRYIVTSTYNGLATIEFVNYGTSTEFIRVISPGGSGCSPLNWHLENTGNESGVPFDFSQDCATDPPPFDMDGEYNPPYSCGIGGTFLSIVNRPTVGTLISRTENEEVWDYPLFNLSGVDTVRVTIRLENPVEPYDQLTPTVCSIEPCILSEEDPECLPCGDYPDGFKYSMPLSPEDCVFAGNSFTAYRLSDGETRASRLALVFKGLTPGETYRATLIFTRCSLVGGDGCEGDCDEEEGHLTIEKEFIFIAEHYAEILSSDCGQCYVENIRSALQAELDAWNTAHPDSTPRTLGCGGDGYDVPVKTDTATTFISCSFEKVTTE